MIAVLYDPSPDLSFDETEQWYALLYTLAVDFPYLLCSRCVPDGFMRRSITRRYQTPYTYQKFSAKELSVLSQARDADKRFALPKANPFLCDGMA
jgi:hypothetical protein